MLNEYVTGFVQTFFENTKHKSYILKMSYKLVFDHHLLAYLYNENKFAFL